MGVSVGFGADSQGRESSIGVELEEGGLEVRAAQEVNLLDVDFVGEIELGTGQDVRIYRSHLPPGEDTHTAISATAAQTEWPKV